MNLVLQRFRAVAVALVLSAVLVPTVSGGPLHHTLF
jgi:hypothetical protein